MRNENDNEIQIGKKIEYLDEQVRNYFLEFEERKKIYQKRMKRLKIILVIVSFYLISIFVVAFLNIFIPSFRGFGEYYLFFSNVASIVFCIYSINNLVKADLLEERNGKILFYGVIMAIMLNVFIILNDLNSGLFS